jgi:uncharacterized protein GlcG (DUF336 family)
MRISKFTLLAAAAALCSPVAFAQELNTQKTLSLDVALAIAHDALDAVGTPGGVPIRVGNDVIGVVGVSGAPGGDQDEACSNAGTAKVASKLK